MTMNFIPSDDFGIDQLDDIPLLAPPSSSAAALLNEDALTEPIGEDFFFDDEDEQGNEQDDLKLNKSTDTLSAPSASLLAMLGSPPSSLLMQLQGQQQPLLCSTNAGATAPSSSVPSLEAPSSVPSLEAPSFRSILPATGPVVPVLHRSSGTSPSSSAPASCVLPRLKLTKTVSEDSICGDDITQKQRQRQRQQYKPVQKERWTQRLSELQLFQKQNGHCLVPHLFPSNPKLARWVKRQRRQYKLKQEGKASTLSDERVAQLEDLGFVWDSHSANWSQKFQELLAYKSVHGNCQVPSTFKPNKELAIWVKCQRRQYKLWRAGKSSSMTAERAASLEKVGFVFEVRASLSCSSPSKSGASSSEAIAVEPLPSTMKQQQAQDDLLLQDDLKLLFDTISQL